MFGDDGKVVSRGKLAHALLWNAAWLHLFCPDDWQIETDIRYIKNKKKKKKKIVPDVKFRDEESILHAVELDRSHDDGVTCLQLMLNMNYEKIKQYGSSTSRSFVPLSQSSICLADCICITGFVLGLLGAITFGGLVLSVCSIT
ncbi:hypothetical protein EXW48_13320 [Bacillus wiedmannii]|nr:hypothetical protein EXW48_13320 [Bacillus wiedmannii]